jgi:hypothetical protein
MATDGNRLAIAPFQGSVLAGSHAGRKQKNTVRHKKDRLKIPRRATGGN